METDFQGWNNGLIQDGNCSEGKPAETEVNGESKLWRLTLRVLVDVGDNTE